MRVEVNSERSILLVEVLRIRRGEPVRLGIYMYVIGGSKSQKIQESKVREGGRGGVERLCKCWSLGGRKMGYDKT